MRCDLAKGYVPRCINCQRNKGSTSKPPGPLHPLLTLDAHFDSVAIDFIRPLPKDDGFDAVVTMTDHLGADIQIMPCNTTTTTKEFAFLFLTGGTAKMDAHWKSSQIKTRSLYQNFGKP
jgi:hypothetical protein